jgi:hypothetical protein
MRITIILLLLLILSGCSLFPRTPQTEEEWGIRCVRILEGVQPDREERFRECFEAWKAWAEEQEQGR